MQRDRPETLTATVHVGHIPELMNEIFSHCDRQTLRSCVLLCSQLSDFARDHLWYYVVHMPDWLTRLAPLAMDSSGEFPTLIFSRPLTEQDWKNFAKDRQRIRHFVFQDTYYTDSDCSTFGRISEKVFLELCRTCPGGRILPNLDCLDWEAEADLMVHLIDFLTPSVTQLEVSFIQPEPMQTMLFDLVCKAIRERCPWLAYLALNASCPVGHYQDQFLSLLEELTGLHAVVLPRFWITPHTLKFLVNNSHIEAVDWQDPPDRNLSGLNDIVHWGFFDMQSTNRFKLQTFSIEAPLHIVRSIFMPAYHPGNLLHLSVGAVYMEKRDEIYIFLAHMAHYQPWLERLELSLVPAVYEDLSQNRSAHLPLTFEDIRPFTWMKHLKDLTIQSPMPFSFRDENMWEIARDCTQIVSISLAPSPTFDFNPKANKLTPSAIVPFMVLCPNLKHLGLYINACLPPAIPLHYRLSGKCQNLHGVDLGSSDIDTYSVKRIARYLWNCLPLPEDRTCRFFTRPLPDEAGSEMAPYIEASPYAFKKRVQLWKEVGRMLERWSIEVGKCESEGWKSSLEATAAYAYCDSH